MRRFSVLFLCALLCIILIPVSAFSGDESQYFIITCIDGDRSVEYEVEAGDYAKIPDPESETYCFDGWFEDPEWESDRIVFDEFEVTGDMTVYARWGEPHDFDEGCVRKESDRKTCTLSGFVTYTCQNCDYEKRVEDPADGHQIEELRDCQNELRGYCCSVCKGYFADEEGTVKLTREAERLAKTGHAALIQHEAKLPTCGENGNYAYWECPDCQKLYSDPEAKHEISRSETIAPRSLAHEFEGNVCKVCGYVRFAFTVYITGRGTVAWNGNPISSGLPVYTDMNQQISLVLTPEDGNHISVFSVNDGTRISGDRTQFEANETNQNSEVNVVFSPSGNPRAVKRTIACPDSFREGLSRISAETGKAGSSIQDIYYEVSAYWNGDLDDPVTDEDLRQAGMTVTFTLGYPEAINGRPYTEYAFYLLRYNAEKDELEQVNDISVGADGITLTTDRLSVYGVYAVRTVADPSDEGGEDDGGSSATGGTGSSSPSGTGTGSQSGARSDGIDAPEIIRINGIYDDGETALGSVTLEGDGRAVEYIRMDTKPDYSTEGTLLDGVTLSELDLAGTYWFRYAAVGERMAGNWIGADVHDYYTVTMTKLFGNGSYEVVNGKHYKGQDDVYYVKGGEDLTVRFRPANHYWLYEININGEYVGEDYVTSTFTLQQIDQQCEISFGFSAESSSPKTGDGVCVALYVGAAVSALTGMFGICCYQMHRRKRKD